MYDPNQPACSHTGGSFYPFVVISIYIIKQTQDYSDRDECSEASAYHIRISYDMRTGYTRI